MKVERGGFRGRLSAFLQKAMAGAAKNTPAGTDGRGASAVSRAQSGARAAPPRYARPRPRAHARAMARETGTPRPVLCSKGGTHDRYRPPPRTAGDRTMTFHDVLQEWPVHRPGHLPSCRLPPSCPNAPSVMPGLVPGIHAAVRRKRWKGMPGTSPGMTRRGMTRRGMTGRRSGRRVPSLFRRPGRLWSLSRTQSGAGRKPGRRSGPEATGP